MPELSFTVAGAEAVPYAATPLLNFRLRVTNADPEETVHTLMLRCQIQIQATRRHYKGGEQAGLRDLFGEPERWSQTLRPLLWTHAQVSLPSFVGSADAILPVPCSFDFNLAATKYFYALEAGEIPLLFLFSGTVFYEAEDGALQVAQIPWENEATFRLPLQVWREMMNLYYPNSAWLRLHQDVFDRLYAYKVRRGLPTWEQAIESLLPKAEG